MMKLYEAMGNLTPDQKREANQLFSKALQRFKSNDYFGAAELYKKAAAYGHPGAQNNLGNLYKTGRGVDKDLRKAFESFLESAKHGNIVGMRNVSSFYMNGIGVETDFDTAVEWLETAVEGGDDLACTMLAEAYDNWQHKDEEKKIYWHKRAADLGNFDSMYFLGEYYKKAGEKQNLSLAKEYLERAAIAGNFNMKLKVAKAFDIPSSENESALSLNRAAYWYNEVVNCDDDKLKFEAAKGLDRQFTYEGELRREALDPEKAYMVYRTLGMRGNREACALAAYCSEIGNGTNPSIDIAIMLYEKAGDKKRAEWCMKKKMGKLSNEFFESHKTYEIPDDVNDNVSQGKEFYSHDFDRKEWDYNGRVYYIKNSYSEKSYVVSSNYEGNDIRIECEISDEYQYGYICVNDWGLYLYYTEDSDRFQIIHYDFKGCMVGEYKELYDESYEDGQCANCICIVDNICFFVHSSDSNGYSRAEIKRVNIDEGGSAEVIYSKANSIERMFATNKVIIFKAEYNNTDAGESASGWMLMDLESRCIESLSNPYCSPETVIEHPEKYNCYDDDFYDENTSYDINIAYFDLNHDVFWTRREAKEGDDSAHLHSVYYLEPHSLRRNRDKIIENYPIWRFPNQNYTGREYFDGKHHYYAENYYTFKSSDKYGNVYDWSKGNGGHGVCGEFRVLGNYLFLNVAAYGEEEYELTLMQSRPIRKSWFDRELPHEAIEKFEKAKG